jgi:hypothetical protein
MAETLIEYQHLVVAPDGTTYRARGCGSPMTGNGWQGWIEFIPSNGGDPVRTGRETTQPNRVDTEYWATGVSAVYLEGALRRALAKPVDLSAPPAQPPAFDGPAPADSAQREAATPATSVLDPFSVYQKGEALLRRQLGALSAWHLVNIILAYDLSEQPVEMLNMMPAAALIDIIVSTVSERAQVPARETARRRG